MQPKTDTTIKPGQRWRDLTMLQKEALFRADEKLALRAQQNPDAPIYASAPRAPVSAAKLDRPRFAVGDRVRITCDRPCVGLNPPPNAETAARRGVVFKVIEGVTVRHYDIDFDDGSTDVIAEKHVEADTAKAAASARYARTPMQVRAIASAPSRPARPRDGKKTWSEMTAGERQRVPPGIAEWMRKEPQARRYRLDSVPQTRTTTNHNPPKGAA